MELQIKFQTSNVSICKGNKKYPIGNQLFTRLFAFKLFHVSIAVANSILSKYYLLFLTNFTTSWQNLNKIRWSEPHKIWIFLTKNLHNYVNHFWYSAILKEVLHVKHNDALSIYHKASSFIIPKIMVIWHFKPNLKLNWTWTISLVFFETVCTLK